MSLVSQTFFRLVVIGIPWDVDIGVMLCFSFREQQAVKHVLGDLSISVKQEPK